MIKRNVLLAIIAVAIIFLCPLSGCKHEKEASTLKVMRDLVVAYKGDTLIICKGTALDRLKDTPYVTYTLQTCVDSLPYDGLKNYLQLNDSAEIAQQSLSTESLNPDVKCVQLTQEWRRDNAARFCIGKDEWVEWRDDKIRCLDAERDNSKKNYGVPEPVLGHEPLEFRVYQCNSTLYLVCGDNFYKEDALKVVAFSDTEGKELTAIRQGDKFFKLDVTLADYKGLRIVPNDRISTFVDTNDFINCEYVELVELKDDGEPEPSDADNKRLWIIVISIFLLLALACLYYFCFRKKDLASDVDTKYEAEIKKLAEEIEKLKGTIKEQKQNQSDAIKKQVDKIEKDAERKIKEAEDKRDAAEAKSRSIKEETENRLNKKIAEAKKETEDEKEAHNCTRKKLAQTETNLRATQDNLAKRTTERDQALNERDRAIKANEVFNSRLAEVAFAADYAAKAMQLFSIGDEAQALLDEMMKRSWSDDYYLLRYIARFASRGGINVADFMADAQNAAKVQLAFRDSTLATYDQNKAPDQLQGDLKSYFFQKYFDGYVNALVTLLKSMVGLHHLMPEMQGEYTQRFAKLLEKTTACCNQMGIEFYAPDVWDKLGNNIDFDVQMVDIDAPSSTIVEFANTLVWLEGGYKPERKICVKVQQ